MQYDLIIKNGIIVTSTETLNKDVFIKDGKIIKIDELNADDTAKDIYDASGLYVLPGVIDAHVHFRDPGLTEKEDFETGSAASAMGGITCVADMPNTVPPTSTAETFKEKIKIAKEKSYIDFALFALLNNDNTDEIKSLADCGALGFKVFYGTSTGGLASPSPQVLQEQLKKCTRLGYRIGFHAEKNEINERCTALFKSKCDDPDGELLCAARPVESECTAIEEILQLAQVTGAKVHIHHVTSGQAARLIEQAKKMGVDVTAETCPHYLFMNADENTHKCYPPIRSRQDVLGLWDALQNKVIDMAATDHAPHTASEKGLPLWSAPAGLSGVETFVPLMLNEVNKGVISINDFVRLACEQPAKIWGIYPQKGNISAGADADFTIADMTRTVKIEAEKLYSKSKTTPFDTLELWGCAVATIVRGQFVMKDNKLIGTKGYGNLITPKK